MVREPGRQQGGERREDPRAARHPAAAGGRPEGILGIRDEQNLGDGEDAERGRGRGREAAPGWAPEAEGHALRPGERPGALQRRAPRAGRLRGPHRAPGGRKDRLHPPRGCQGPQLIFIH